MLEPLGFSDASPRVSVVMAAYNYGQYIAQAIQSVVDQSYADWELIVVDDGSTDDTREVASRFLGDRRIRYHYQENRGQPSAENAGIALSKADYIAFLDADDLWLNTKLEKQIPRLEESPELGLIYSRRLMIDPRGRRLKANSNPCFRGSVLPALFQQNFICFSSSVVRRRAIEEAGGFNEEYRHANDYDLWLRLALKHQFDYVDEPLVCYRTGHPNLTSHGDRQLQTAIRIMERFCDSHPHAIHRSLRSSCFCETYCHLALSYRKQHPGRALVNYLKALRYSPVSYDVWRGMGALCLPESLRRLARRVLGRPLDWPKRELFEKE